MKHILLLSALSLMGTVACAEDTSKTSDSFMMLDTDQNGVISKSEAANSQSLAPVFDQADANQDGALDVEEFAKIEFQPVEQQQ